MSIYILADYFLNYSIDFLPLMLLLVSNDVSGSLNLLKIVNRISHSTASVFIPFTLFVMLSSSM